jgi:hypothetical protein
MPPSNELVKTNMIGDMLLSGQLVPIGAYHQPRHAVQKYVGEYPCPSQYGKVTRMRT